MTADRQELREWITQIMARLGTAVRSVLLELASSLREAFSLASRLAVYASYQLRLWRLRKEIAASELLVGESALITRQGDEALRSQLSDANLAQPKDRRLRAERERLIRRLAADVKGRIAAGETAELLRTKDEKEAYSLELASSLANQRLLLFPRERTARRRVVIGQGAALGIAVIFCFGLIGYSDRNEIGGALSSQSASTSPSSISMDSAASAEEPKKGALADAIAPKLYYADAPSGLVTSHPMIALTENLNLVISFVAISPDRQGSHDVRGLVGLVDIYDFEESTNRNNTRFAKAVFRAGTDEFRLYLPDLIGGSNSMRYCYKDMDARNFHSFLYSRCLMGKAELEVEVAGKRMKVGADGQRTIAALVADVATQLRANGYDVSNEK